MELFRKYEFLNISVDVIQGYAPETGFWFVSVDVIRPNVGRNTRLLSRNKFFSSFCGRIQVFRGDGKTLGFVPETPLFLVCFLFPLGTWERSGRQLCVTALMLPPIPVPSPNFNLKCRTK